MLTYAHPDVWEQAWWVPLLFGASTLGGLLAAEGVRRLVGGPPLMTSPALALVDVASFAAAYYLTAVAHHVPDVLTVILGVTWLIRAISGLPGWAVACCIGAALVGPAVEATVSELGGFHYLHPDFIGVARWLPALYLHVGVVAVSISSLLWAPRAVDVDV